MHYCILREYVKAHDKYLEISIGNSPWPMGVTMVGIHERSGRAKIFSSQVARNIFLFFIIKINNIRYFK